jgi:hypothetical protein
MTSFVVPTSLMLSLFLFGGVVHSLELRALPQLDIWILCSDGGIKDYNLDSAGELKNYYTDLLPSGTVITIDGGEPEFLYCTVNDNRTQVQILAYGSAEFESESVMWEDDMLALVTVEALEALFQNNVCEEGMDVFDAAVEDEGSKLRNTCSPPPPSSLDATVKVFQRGLIIIIVLVVVIVLCVILCLCGCCCRS